MRALAADVATMRSHVREIGGDVIYSARVQVISVFSFGREGLHVCAHLLCLCCLFALSCLASACHGSADPDCGRCRAGAACAATCGKLERADAGLWRPPAAPKSTAIAVGASEASDDAGPATTFARDAGADVPEAAGSRCLDGKASSRELCNALDDDCDGAIDEDTTVACYPDGAAGCSVADGGTCAGICTRGERRCSDGALGICVGAKTPSPQGESCNGLDDDCNGVVDDGFDLDTNAQHCGRCDHACAPGAVCCAGQCVDPTQKEHCGGCGPAHVCASDMACCKGSCAPADAMGGCPTPPPATSECDGCARGQACCDDHCVNLAGNDPDHCGACGNKCTKGRLPGCCAGTCVDLLSDTTCGRCDNACGLFKLGGGFLCHCEMIDAGPSCVGGDVGEALQVCY